MCTVTYLPAREGFVLTHNRDEAPTRSPQRIDRIILPDGVKVICPRDTKAGGSWIAASGSGGVACLLNGAFLKHRHEPPYRRSRGLVVLDFFAWPSPDLFFRDYPLEGIEPFTFLYFDARRVCEFRWDGRQRYIREYSSGEALFWCSATLYPPEMQIRREAVFRDWLRSADTGAPRIASNIRKLHHTGSVNDPENDYRMNRGGRVQTVSVTQIVVRKHRIQMQYEDLLNGHLDRKQIFLTS